MKQPVFALALALALVGATGCYVMRPSSGSGQASYAGEPRRDPAAVVVPPDYQVELLAEQLNFPVGVAINAEGAIYVVESGYSYGEVFTEPGCCELPMAPRR